MNFIKRSFLSIKGRPFKSFILLMTIFILSSVLSGAFIIVGSSNKLEASIKSKIGAAITIENPYSSPNSTAFMEKHSEINPTYDELLTVFEELRLRDDVNDIDFRTWTKLIDFNTLSFNSSGQCFWQPIGRICHDVKYSGVSSADFFELRSKTIKIKNGRNFTASEVIDGSHVILVSDALSNINIGDFIEYEAIAYDSNSLNPQKELVDVYGSKKYLFEVIGTFEEQDSFDSPNDVTKLFDYDNHVFMPSAILSQVRFDLDDFYLSANPQLKNHLPFVSGYLAMDRIQVSLDSVDSIDKVREETSSILSSRWILKDLVIKSSTDDFNKIVGPIKNLKSVSTLIFRTSIFATIVILSLIILIFLRERKHEMGIYLSMGEDKFKVVGQIIVEVLLIALIGITLSLVSAKLVAEKLAATMVNVQTISDEQFETYLGNKLTQKEIIDQYQFNFSYVDIISIYGISVLTVLVSVMIPSFYILRLNPKKILI